MISIRWSDVNGYYSRFPRLLQVSDLKGTLRQLSVTMNSLVKLAQLSERKLLLPTHADIVDGKGAVQRVLWLVGFVALRLLR